MISLTDWLQQFHQYGSDSQERGQKWINSLRDYLLSLDGFSNWPSTKNAGHYKYFGIQSGSKYNENIFW